MQFTRGHLQTQKLSPLCSRADAPENMRAEALKECRMGASHCRDRVIASAACAGLGDPNRNHGLQLRLLHPEIRAGPNVCSPGFSRFASQHSESAPDQVKLPRFAPRNSLMTNAAPVLASCAGF